MPPKSSPEEGHKSHTSHQLKLIFPLLTAVILSLFLCLLLKIDVKCSQYCLLNGNGAVDSESLVDEHLLRLMDTYLGIKEELKVKRKKKRRKKQ